MGFSVDLGLWRPIGLWDSGLFAGWGLLGDGFAWLWGRAWPYSTGIAPHSSATPASMQRCQWTARRRSAASDGRPQPQRQYGTENPAPPRRNQAKNHRKEGEKRRKTQYGRALPLCPASFGGFLGGGGLWGGVWPHICPHLPPCPVAVGVGVLWGVGLRGAGRCWVFCWFPPIKVIGTATPALCGGGTYGVFSATSPPHPNPWVLIQTPKPSHPHPSSIPICINPNAIPSLSYSHSHPKSHPHPNPIPINTTIPIPSHPCHIPVPYPSPIPVPIPTLILSDPNPIPI